ncbi:hypothetical protein V3C99_013267 [Haemonchus contortus]
MALSEPKAKRPCPVHAQGLLDEEDEDHLAKKLFSGNFEKLQESSSDEEEDSTVQEEGTQRGLSSVWRDDDDVEEEVQLPSGKTAVILKRSTDSGGSIAANEYHNRLRKAFQRHHHGTPKWAKLEQKKAPVQSAGDESDAEIEEVFDEMTRSSIRYVEKDHFLTKDIVSSFRWPDITVGHRDSREINCILFHNVRPVLIASGASGMVQLFRVGDRSEEGNFLQNVRFSNFPVTSMGMLTGGCSLMCGSIRQEYLMKYDLEEGAVMQVRLPKCIPNQNIGRFAISKDGSLLAMIARNAQVYVLSSSSMELVKTLSAPTDLASVQFFPGSNNEIWALTERGEVIIWNLNGYQHLFRDEGAVRGTKVRLSVDGNMIACGSNTGIVNLYDVTDARNSTEPKPRAVVPNLLTSCDSIAFSHDSQAMAFSSNVKKNQIKLLHVASSTVFKNFPKRHEKMPNIECVEFSPHSAFLAIGCGNGQLILERMNYYEDY